MKYFRTIVTLAALCGSSTAFAPRSRAETNAALLKSNSMEGQWRRYAVENESTRTAVEERDEIMQEASEKLQNVGWALPTDGDLTSEDPFVQAIDAGIQRDVGVSLDELLNPAKVVNLERDLFELRQELASCTGAQVVDTQFATTEECDGGGGGADADLLREKIAKKERDLAMERRSVFRGWLKNVFLVQAVLSFGISYVMATNPSSLFGGFGWFYVYNMDISIQVLGYWWWWLFVVPSLRSRRPKGLEKKALDWAFLGTPLVSILAPVATKDTGLIWGANLAVVLGCYAAAFLIPEGDGGDDDDDDADTPEWLKFVYKSLDFGSGRERGARS
mmetsp:Transcript_16198/g.33509  ORF Transcript_16198/g.33509 Transcript_16198/m.33509 type:complete len:333 (-) Transcript_16198:275-1273(-)|eukprot:CAMPEP_0172473040 /NCGR_PEP_ID=MMETSP1065-20121228/68650_1 /TAXON_ID=265537 /ORGANISM="Amphiprora paludosa, Strain CCMP125" /LENGTH=332 /DNA_ID=CAMNT_0013231209 /DNA_START=40 /DNA_END=1038 /DNA_ORIENTATION=+